MLHKITSWDLELTLSLSYGLHQSWYLVAQTSTYIAMKFL